MDMDKSFVHNPTMKCPHINESVNLAKVEKALSTKSIQVSCEACMKKSMRDGVYGVLNMMKICLKCGNQACGRYWNKHALCHYESRIGSHFLCVDTKSFDVWCYECHQYVVVSSDIKLIRCVQLLKAEIRKAKEESSSLNNSTLGIVDAMQNLTTEAGRRHSANSAVKSEQEEELNMLETSKQTSRSSTPSWNSKRNASYGKEAAVRELAHSVFSSPDEDEYDVVGKRFAFQLRGMEERQRIIAEKLISDIMFYGQLGQLSENAMILKHI